LIIQAFYTKFSNSILYKNVFGCTWASVSFSHHVGQFICKTSLDRISA
jgi:hypothetical protein